jgi:Transcriptional regulator
MDLSTLQYYVAVCELNNMSKAANKLFISRQAISKSISNLENMLDTQLIIVRHEGIELTEEGQCLYNHALRLIEGWNNAVNEIQSIKRTRRMTIHVGYDSMTYNLWDNDHIEQFKAQNLNIDILAEVMPPDQLFIGLKDRRLDVAITSANNDAECFTVTTIKHRPIYALFCVDDLLAAQSHISPKDLSGRIVYFTPDNQAFFTSFDKLIHHEQVEVNCQYCTDSNLLTVLQAVKQNHGIFLTSGIFRRFLCTTEEFVLKPFILDGAEILLNKNILAITRCDATSNAAIKRYVDYLQTTIRNVS